MTSSTNAVVVVAGPGGAGKSTFISLLGSEALPGEIRDLLPDDIGSWPALMPGVFRTPRGLKPPPVRYVLHYDTTGHARKWNFDYSADLALAGVEAACHVTVVDIRPSKEALIHQLEYRSIEADWKRGRISRIWSQSFLRALVQRGKTLRRLKSLKKPDLYRQAGWLEQAYASWDAYLQALQSRTELLVIRVEPHEGASRLRSFRFVECRGSSNLGKISTSQ